MARKGTKVIYNPAYVLNWIRIYYTNGGDLVRPTITEFAIIFISSQYLFKFRNEVRQMRTSNSCSKSSYSSTPIGLEISNNILNNSFWRNRAYILKVSEYLVTILHLVDNEDGSHGLSV